MEFDPSDIHKAINFIFRMDDAWDNIFFLIFIVGAVIAGVKWLYKPYDTKKFNDDLKNLGG